MVRFISIITLLVAFGQVNALPLNITNITGDWVNPDVIPPIPGTFTVSNVAGQGTDTFTWGLGGQSSYLFTPGASITGVPVGSAFQLGQFEFINNATIFPVLNSIDYSFNFDTNGTPASLGGLLNFSHTESGDSGAVNDLIDVLLEQPVNPVITVGLDTYTLSILGFSTDSGATISNSFQIAEFSDFGPVGLFAQVVADSTSPPAPIPEPGTLALFGLGLLFTGLVRRKLAS